MAKRILLPMAESQPQTKFVDPITRIEGHLGVKIEVENGVVVNAWSSGLLWRGFERILLDRDPRDAPILTSRICGVCHAVHRLTSILALEDSVNLTPTPDAIRIRNIEQGINFIYSHAAHIFILAGPDYDLYGLVPGLSEGQDLDAYYQILKDIVLPAQRLCHQIAAIFGGKVPHHMTTLAGGVTCVPNENAINAVLDRISEIKTVVSPVASIVLDFLNDNRTELEGFGIGCENFLSYGVFPDPDDPKNLEKFLLKRGVIIDGVLLPLDVDKIIEEVKHSWYTDDSGGKPADEIPPKDSYEKPDAYSWAKSPRYGVNVCEVGPLARMAVSDHYEKKASLYDRLMARAQELVLVLTNVETWVNELTPGAEVYVQYTNPESAMGTGLWEAPRGANGHWVNISGTKIGRYQIVSPTAWNISPRDDIGQMGAIEQALIGTPVEDPEKPINALKVVRSFDPCLACAVHVVTLDGKSYRVE